MRFLTDADVAALLPPPAETVALAREALVARASGEAEVPPKPAVHTVPGSFANAMPAIPAGRSRRSRPLPTPGGLIPPA